MLHGNEAVRVRARVRVFPRASCGVLPARGKQRIPSVFTALESAGA